MHSRQCQLVHSWRVWAAPAGRSRSDPGVGSQTHSAPQGLRNTAQRSNSSSCYTRAELIMRASAQSPPFLPIMHACILQLQYQGGVTRAVPGLLSQQGAPCAWYALKALLCT